MVSVIGLMILTAIPTVTGVAQAVHGQKEQAQRVKDLRRMEKFYIDVFCEAQSSRVHELHEKRLILKDTRVWIGPHEALNPLKDAYVVEAFYIEYPDNERDPVPLGLVSQVQVDPPLLNWIYIDTDTMELRHGNKTVSCAHHVGPWDWTKDEQGVTLNKFERFTAVEHPATRQWQLYFDNDDDGLKRYVPKGRRKFQISLERTMIPGAQGGK